MNSKIYYILVFILISVLFSCSNSFAEVDKYIDKLHFLDTKGLAML